jgi:hypothetical protein
MSKELRGMVSLLGLTSMAGNSNAPPSSSKPALKKTIRRMTGYANRGRPAFKLFARIEKMPY